MSDAEDDLSPTVRELADRLREFRDRADASDGVLQFTERYAIPTAIAGLEANIRALEALAGAIRLLQGTEETTARARARREAAVETVDRAVEDVTAALRGDPTDPEARELLQEVRDLRAEIRDRVDGRLPAEETEEAGDPEQTPIGEGVQIPVTDATASEGGEDGTNIDVEGELETIRDEVADERTVFDDYDGENR
ncbi:hypothetical protein DM867_11720 [Halosegnis rubeus]|jgi:hypothetical protein|uniref:Uncharacterized protein n=1 Tax=Halosegnis rubeus TaxID=2212850 RepID=A0A5N5U348_9EURY|nr:hypothetical protein [Halosegnis rubeus]KAB7512857.1 hypothetical protein DM867_11720 [Halosegnis rubeus]KAB7512973.1 hypothetical protein DMP03_13575 [Halosegnis rubeus]KAB7513696.1 hypothetical protein DP108_12665 [Halosegnis rubeus]